MNKILFCLLVLFSNLTYANYIDDTCPQFVIWGAPKVKVESNRQYMCKTAYAINYNYTRGARLYNSFYTDLQNRRCLNLHIIWKLFQKNII